MQKSIVALILGASLAAVSGEPDQHSSARPASVGEIQELFGLATNGQPRAYFVANIELREPAFTEEQVADELRAQNKLMQNADRIASRGHYAEQQAARSNAIARSRSGLKLLHVEEWYSGNHYRLDQTDESAVTPEYLKANSGAYHDTFVNILDPTFSPYNSFSVNHELKDALLTKDVNGKWATYRLWEARGLESEVGGPLIAALVDTRSLSPTQHISGEYLKTLGIDAWKAQRLHSDSDSTWHLAADEETLAGVLVTRFSLTGKYPDVESGQISMSSIELSYWIGHIAGRPVCFQAGLTNLTQGSSYLSERADFADNGYPTIWKTSKFKSGNLLKQMSVKFIRIDLEPEFVDEKIFAPVFASNYVVSDITSGKSVILQDPRPGIKTVEPGSAERNKRTIILCALALIAILPLAAAIWIKRRSSFKT